MSEQPQPQKEAAFFTTIRQWGLARGAHGVIGGVVEGLGARVGMAAVPARLIVVLAALLLPGFVMLAYAAAWGLLPDRRGTIIIQNFGRGVTNVGALLGIAILTLFGFGALDSGGFASLFGVGMDPWIWDSGMFSGGGGIGDAVRAIAVLLAITIPLLMISGVIVLIVWLVKRSKDTTTPPGGVGTPGGPGTPNGPGTPGGPGPADAAVAPTTPPASPTTAEDGSGAQAPGSTASSAAAQAEGASPSAVPASASQPARASAVDPTAVHTPQPWEPALAPGDPRLAPIAGPRRTPPGTPSGPPAPYASAPPAPPAPPAPYHPPRPHVPGPGKGGYLAFLGVLLVAAAVAIGIERADRLAINPVLAWGAIVTVGLGAVLVVVALTGRKLGFLGFLSVVAVVAGVPLAANADDLRAEFDQPWGWWDVNVTVNEGSTSEPEPSIASPEPAAADLTSELADDYSSIFIAGSCVSPTWAEPWESIASYGDSIATMRLDAVDSDLDLDLTATSTRVEVPAGTSIEVAGSGTTTVVWEDRDISCESWTEPSVDGGDGGSQTVLTMTNPDTPVLTLNAAADSTIYLEEVSS